MKMYKCNICGEIFFEDEIIINEYGERACPVCELEDYEVDSDEDDEEVECYDED